MELETIIQHLSNYSNKGMRKKISKEVELLKSQVESGYGPGISFSFSDGEMFPKKFRKEFIDPARTFYNRARSVFSLTGEKDDLLLYGSSSYEKRHKNSCVFSAIVVPKISLRYKYLSLYKTIAKNMADVMKERFGIQFFYNSSERKYIFSEIVEHKKSWREGVFSIGFSSKGVNVSLGIVNGNIYGDINELNYIDGMFSQKFLDYMGFFEEIYPHIFLESVFEVFPKIYQNGDYLSEMSISVEGKYAGSLFRFNVGIDEESHLHVSQTVKNDAFDNLGEFLKKYKKGFPTSSHVVSSDEMTGLFYGRGSFFLSDSIEEMIREIHTGMRNLPEEVFEGKSKNPAMVVKNHNRFFFKDYGALDREDIYNLSLLHRLYSQYDGVRRHLFLREYRDLFFDE